LESPPLSFVIQTILREETQSSNVGPGMVTRPSWARQCPIVLNATDLSRWRQDDRMPRQAAGVVDVAVSSDGVGRLSNT